MAYWKLELQLYLSLCFNYCTHLLVAFPHSCQKDVNTSLHFVVVCTFALLKLPKKFLACFATWQSHSELHLPKRASNHTEKWVGGSSLSLFIERERENAKNFRIKEKPARQVGEGYRHRWRGGLVLFEILPGKESDGGRTLIRNWSVCSLPVMSAPTGPQRLLLLINGLIKSQTSRPSCSMRWIMFMLGGHLLSFLTRSQRFEMPIFFKVTKLHSSLKISTLHGSHERWLFFPNCKSAH